jgi:hypothetical protein
MEVCLDYCHIWIKHLDKSDNFFSQSDCFAPQTKKIAQAQSTSNKSENFFTQSVYPFNESDFFSVNRVFYGFISRHSNLEPCRLRSSFLNWTLKFRPFAREKMMVGPELLEGRIGRRARPRTDVLCRAGTDAVPAL